MAALFLKRIGSDVDKDNFMKFIIEHTGGIKPINVEYQNMKYDGFLNAIIEFKSNAIANCALEEWNASEEPPNYKGQSITATKYVKGPQTPVTSDLSRLQANKLCIHVPVEVDQGEFTAFLEKQFGCKIVDLKFAFYRNQSDNKIKNSFITFENQETANRVKTQLEEKTITFCGVKLKASFAFAPKTTPQTKTPRADGNRNAAPSHTRQDHIHQDHTRQDHTRQGRRGERHQQWNQTTPAQRHRMPVTNLINGSPGDESVNEAMTGRSSSSVTNSSVTVVPVNHPNHPNNPKNAQKFGQNLRNERINEHSASNHVEMKNLDFGNSSVSASLSPISLSSRKGPPQAQERGQVQQSTHNHALQNNSLLQNAPVAAKSPDVKSTTNEMARLNLSSSRPVSAPAQIVPTLKNVKFAPLLYKKPIKVVIEKYNSHLDIVFKVEGVTVDPNVQTILNEQASATQNGLLSYVVSGEVALCPNPNRKQSDDGIAADYSRVVVRFFDAKSEKVLVEDLDTCEIFEVELDLIRPMLNESCLASPVTHFHGALSNCQPLPDPQMASMFEETLIEQVTEDPNLRAVISNHIYNWVDFELLPCDEEQSISEIMIECNVAKRPETNEEITRFPFINPMTLPLGAVANCKVVQPVTYSPCDIFLQRNVEECLEINLLYEWSNRELIYIPNYRPFPMEVVCTMYEEEWIRANVLYVDANSAKLYAIDWGDILEQPLVKIRPAPKDMIKDDDGKDIPGLVIRTAIEGFEYGSTKFDSDQIEKFDSILHENDAVKINVVGLNKRLKSFSCHMALTYDDGRSEEDVLKLCIAKGVVPPAAANVAHVAMSPSLSSSSSLPNGSMAAHGTLSKVQTPSVHSLQLNSTPNSSSLSHSPKELHAISDSSEAKVITNGPEREVLECNDVCDGLVENGTKADLGSDCEGPSTNHQLQGEVKYLRSEVDQLRKELNQLRSEVKQISAHVLMK